MPRTAHVPGWLNVRRLVAVLALGAWLLTGATNAWAQADPDAPAAAIAALNAQRAANGIPAGIVERADWDAACQQHVRYMRDNGGALTHHEDPAAPGYTEDGAWAGQSSVLASDGWGADGSNPWQTAPIHLMQLLAPQLAQTGYWHGCMVTWPGYTRPLPALPQLFSYPGNGSRDVPSSEVAAEAPFTPNDFVGLRGVTGPYLYLLAFGDFPFAGGMTDESLTGPGGPVDIRTVDDTTTGPKGFLGSYLPPGGMIIPVSPLRPATTYTAQASYGGLTRRWTFTTSRLDPELLADVLADDSGGIGVGSQSPAAATITLTHRHGTAAWRRTVSMSGDYDRPTWAPLPRHIHGSYKLCVTQSGTDLYSDGTYCRRVRVAKRMSVRRRLHAHQLATTVRPVGHRLRFVFRSAGSVRGARLTYRVCGPHAPGKPLCSHRHHVRLGRKLTVRTVIPTRSQAHATVHYTVGGGYAHAVHRRVRFSWLMLGR